jgi:ion channel
MTRALAPGIRFWRSDCLNVPNCAQSEVTGFRERPHMFSQLLLAWCLMALNVVIHAWGVTSLLRRLRRQSITPARLLPLTWLFVHLAGWIVVLHATEITTWAVAFAWTRALPELQSALYFSAVTYTTTGYGDLVLPERWRLVGAVEALTGILMCGWSTGFFFAVVSRIHSEEERSY